MLHYLRLLLLFLACALPARGQVGLVAAFPCNEGSGTTISDVTATHHLGTLNGAGWTASGKYGAGLTFNGSSSWVTIPDHPSLDLTTGATLMAWVYPTLLGSYRTVIMKETVGGAAYYLYSGPGDLAMGGGGFAGGTYHETSGGVVLPLNAWTHLATTYDGANIRVYRNGVLVATLANTGSFDQSNSPLRLGGNSTWSEWWQGRIDEVRVYNRALSAAEIVTDRDTPIIAGSMAPIIAATIPPQETMVRSLAQIDVQFSEAVTGVDAGDLLVAGAAATGLTPLGNNTYRFSFPEQVNGPVNVSFIAGHGIADTEAPPVAFAGASWNYTVDPNAPLEAVRINEVIAANVAGGLADEDDDFEDWVELLNTGTNSVNLGGWSLTDDAAVPGKWVFPVRTLAPGGYLVVFLSEKNRAPGSGNLHTNFKLKLTGGALRLYNGDVPRVLVSAFDPLPAQQPGLSYGVNGSGLTRFFAIPTPGAANGGTEYIGIAAAPVPNVGAGYFSAAFNLTLTSTTPGASIRYTTDGTPPSATSTLYSNPLNIGATTVLRAAAFAPGYAPSNAITRTYLFLADVLTQSPTGTTPPGWPSTWGPNRVDYGMDPDVIGPGAPYASRALGAMQAIPALSIVMKLPDLFDTTTGIYANAAQNGDGWERPASLELLNPNGAPGFQENGGLRIRGNFSRDRNNSKHSFRMFFRERYGAGKLDFPLFGAGAAEKHDVVDLRTSQDFSWAYLASTEATFVTDSFARDLMEKMGQETTRGYFYHLFINGQYWGLYNTEERVNQSYAANYFGGAETDYDVVKVDSFNTQAADGTFDAWTQLWSLTEAGVSSDAAMQALLGNNPDGTRNPALPVHLDATNICDYMLMNFILDNADGPTFIAGGVPNNFFGVRPRDGHFGWRFLAHDSEYSMFNVSQDVTGPPTAIGTTLTSSNPRRMWEKCMANAEFRSFFADRVQKHCFGNGALTPAGQTALWQARAAEIDQAVIGESARWGDSARAAPLTRDTDWLPRINFFVNSWFPSRTGIVISQLRARGYFPALAAPTVAPLPGTVEPGTVVTLTQNPVVGVIFYTLDGTDPRRFGGSRNPAAQVWPGSYTLLSSVRLRARVQNGASWSPLVEADYFLAQDFAKLAVSEVMFNAPGAGATDGAEFEFIELTNTGNKTLDLGGLTFTPGIGGTFPAGTTLLPGGYLVAARNPAVFNTRYPGVPVALAFTGKLDNNGETITLAEPGGGVIFKLTYNNAPPWPAAASGLGYSIVNVAPGTYQAPDEGSRWRASTALYGSPGAADPAPMISPVMLGEILAGAGGFIELHNLSDAVVHIGGWTLTDDLLVPAKAVIAGGTTIPSNGAVHFTAASLGFALDPAGGSVFVLARSGGALTGYSHGWKLNATDAAFALGRVVDTTGAEALVPLAAPTPGEIAATPLIGPVVINEIWYHPLVGLFEAVELRNIGASAVALDGWRLDGFGYSFPAGASIAGSGFALVVADDPATFRTRHSIPAAVPIFGVATGTLENSGERLSLERPSTLTPGVFVTLESLRYNDKPPWPGTADGSGPSLQRISSSVLALEPTNWQGFGLTLGRANATNIAPTAAITAPVHLTTFAPPGAFTIFATAGDADGQIVRVEFYDGSTKIGEDATAPYTLPLTNVAAGDHWLTARAIDDAYAGTASIPVLVTGLGSVPFIVSPWGATWRCRDNGTAPPANWTLLAYDDSAWKTGAAELGYGDNDEATVVEDNPTPGYNASDTNRYITTWFRRTFTVTDVPQITGLAGRMIRDDGVAVYLNGTEIWRDNLAVGAGPGTSALSGISGTGETAQITKTLNSADLVEGVNVLAVEVHQFGADSSDITFNLELAAARPATTPDPDTDGDGMRDAWEMAHGFAYWNAADAALDADGDGSRNVVEFRLGLDPRDAGQSFRATLGPGFLLAWPSAPGLTFTIERTLTLSPANWLPIGTVNAGGSTATFTDPAPPAGGGFYRVKFAP
jgi:hypothetical protein